MIISKSVVNDENCVLVHTGMTSVFSTESCEVDGTTSATEWNLRLFSLLCISLYRPPCMVL